MQHRPVLGVLAGLLLAPLGLIAAGTPAHADAGVAGYTYICDRISPYGDDTTTLSVSKLYTCSNGPMDDTIVSRLDNYTGKSAGHTSGECIWYLHYRKGYTDMAKAFDYCVAHPRLQIS